jgi:hypothetical protein
MTIVSRIKTNVSLRNTNAFQEETNRNGENTIIIEGNTMIIRKGLKAKAKDEKKSCFKTIVFAFSHTYSP